MKGPLDEMIARRSLLKWLVSALLIPRAGFASAGRVPPVLLTPLSPARDNFQRIYGDPRLREGFRDFLVHVYHLYPEDRLHALIGELARPGRGDAEIYRELQKRIPGVKPFLSELTYAIPALAQQKAEMVAQTAKLLQSWLVPIRGYVEIGTPGRYVKGLERALSIEGPVYLVHDHDPSLLSPSDIVERGQLARVGAYVPLDDYAPLGEDRIPSRSVDVVSNFIGIHHAPRERLDDFMRSIRRVLRPGGRLVLRDHDSRSPQMHAMIGLAHDVFNAGLGVPWETNVAELRHFRALGEIEAYLAGFGFERTAEPLYQKGDPTLNALMLFTRNSAG